MIWRRKHYRSCSQVFRRSAKKIFGAGSLLGDSYIVCGFYELSELFVSDERDVDEVRIKINPVPRAGVFEHWLIGAHPELATRYPNHSGRRRRGCAHVVRTKGCIGQGNGGSAFRGRNPALASHSLGCSRMPRRIRVRISPSLAHSEGGGQPDDQNKSASQKEPSMNDLLLLHFSPRRSVCISLGRGRPRLLFLPHPFPPPPEAHSFSSDRWSPC